LSFIALTIRSGRFQRELLGLRRRLANAIGNHMQCPPSRPYPSKSVPSGLHVASYIELHTARAFSFLEAASQPEQLIDRAVELEMPAIALLDRNGFYGSARFNTSAKLNDVRAHVGAEVVVSSLGLRLTPPTWLPHQHTPEPARLAFLCESREGYQNLCLLITQFKMREATKQEGAATFNDLQQYASGLVCLTGGDEGPLAAALMRGGEEEGRKVVEQLIRIFGADNVYVEL
jgi:error-prone DNA polymerase